MQQTNLLWTLVDKDFNIKLSSWYTIVFRYFSLSSSNLRFPYFLNVFILPNFHGVLLFLGSSSFLLIAPKCFLISLNTHFSDFIHQIFSWVELINKCFCSGFL